MKTLFIFNDYSLHNQIVSNYCKRCPADQISLIKVNLVIKGKSRWQTAGSILPRLAKSFILQKAIEVLFSLLITFIPSLYRRSHKFKRLSTIAKKYKIDYLATNNIMDRPTIEYIKKFQPDLIICLFHQIIKEELIKIPTLGILNIHPGILPNFRGIQPYFWSLSTGHPVSGATVHYVEDEGVDTGRIIARIEYDNPEDISVHLNYFLSCQSLAQVLPEIISDLVENRIIPEEQKTEGNYYRWPDQNAMQDLKSRGRSLFKFKHFFNMLRGTYDDFKYRKQINRS